MTESLPTAPLKRPDTVKVAVILLWSEALLCEALMLTTEGLFDLPARWIVLILVGPLAVFGFIFNRIAAGSNWARILYLVLTLLNLAGIFSSSTSNSASSLQEPTVPLPVGIFLGMINIIAIVMLFMPSARPWFSRRRTRNAPAPPDERVLSAMAALHGGTETEKD